MGDKDLLRLQHDHPHPLFPLLHSRDGPQYALDRGLVRRVRLQPRLEPYSKILRLHAAARRLERAAHFRLGKFRRII